MDKPQYSPYKDFNYFSIALATEVKILVNHKFFREATAKAGKRVVRKRERDGERLYLDMLDMTWSSNNLEKAKAFITHKLNLFNIQ